MSAAVIAGKTYLNVTCLLFCYLSRAVLRKFMEVASGSNWLGSLDFLSCVRTEVRANLSTAGETRPLENLFAGSRDESERCKPAEGLLCPAKAT